MSSFLVLLLVVVSLACPCLGLYRVATDFGSLRSLMEAERDVFLLHFVDSADPMSLRLKPLVSELVVSLEGFVDVVELDVRNPSLSFALSAWGVQAIPSFKILPSGIGRENGLGTIKQPVDYEGRMALDDLKRFALQAIPSRGLIDRVEKDTSLDALRRRWNGGGSKALSYNVTILITDKDATSVLFRRVSQKFSQRMHFVEIVGKKCPTLVKQLQAEFHTQASKTPLFVLVSDVAFPYTRENNIHDMSAWLEPFAAAPQAAFGERKRLLLKEGAHR